MSTTTSEGKGWTPGPWAIETPMGDDLPWLVEDGKPTYEWRCLAQFSFGDDLPRREMMANATLMSAATDLFDAASAAITALAFAQETYHASGDVLAFAQTTSAKSALIAAQNKALGRNQPTIRDVTPHRAALAKAEGRTP